MSHQNCQCHPTNPSLHQTLLEMDFERGLWNPSSLGDLESVKRLLKNGADPNKPDNNGYIPLHYAARAGHIEICEALLEGGSCVNLKTTSTLATPLHRAAYAGRENVVKLLLKKSRCCGFMCTNNCKNVVQEQDFEGKTCLHKAVEEKKWNIAECLLIDCPQILFSKDKYGVTCDNCMTTGFTGQRFKCLICFDFDLCHECYMAGAFSTNHLPSHSMQCILTRSQLEIVLGGEAGGHILQSFQCPFCSELGFNTHLLETHVRNMHKDKLSVEVICPICSVTPSSEPNRITTDLPQHILSTHKKPVLDMYEEDINLGGGGLRQIRRVNNPSRGAISSQRMRTNLQTMTFNEQNKESLSELLSQLSVTRGVRTQAANVSGISSHLQHLESQLSTTRQHLERLRTLNVDLSMREAIFSQLPPPSSKPPKMTVLNGVIVNDSGASLSSGFSGMQQTSTDPSSTHHASGSLPSSGAKASNQQFSTAFNATAAAADADGHHFLLSGCLFDNRPPAAESYSEEASKRCLFAQELTLSIMAHQNHLTSLLSPSLPSPSSSSFFSNPSPLHCSEETCKQTTSSSSQPPLTQTARQHPSPPHAPSNALLNNCNATYLTPSSATTSAPATASAPATTSASATSLATSLETAATTAKEHLTTTACTTKNVSISSTSMLMTSLPSTPISITTSSTATSTSKTTTATAPQAVVSDSNS